MKKSIVDILFRDRISFVFWLFLFPILLFQSSECQNIENITPPIAKIIPKVDSMYEDIRIDNYFWLKERDNLKVIEYLHAENNYTKAMMKHTEEFQEKLYKELLGRIKETDMSVPEKIDNYYYYIRTEEDEQYPIYCRKKEKLDSPEEILLNLNLLSVGYNYYNLGIYKISPNHQLLAYSIDTTGSELYTLYIKDLNTGELLEDIISNIGYSFAWANDNKTFFYTLVDKAKRPYKLYRHLLGCNTEEDIEVYHEKDEKFWLYIYKTKSRNYLLMESSTHTTSEIAYLDANNPTLTFKIVHPRKFEMKYYLYHHNDKFFILTNYDAKNFKLMETSVINPSKENWKEVISHRDSVMLEGVDVFKDYLVVYEREKGLENIHITDLVNNETYYVDFPEPVYTFWSGRNSNYNSNLLRYTYMSLVTPKSVIDYNMSTKTQELKKQYEVLGGYESSNYQSERIFVQAKDSTKIPISLVYRKGMLKNGNNPLLLCGYGAYGENMEPYFSSNRLSLLDRGFIFAIAHVRGGGEMGKFLYEQGKLLNKKNTFTDFIACSEYLIKKGYTSSDKLIISGGSAGGLLVGAVINMRPNLYKAVIADVPFVDVLNTMLDPTLPRTILEYEEWGNPNEEEYYDYIKSYSPYYNVEAQYYPNILINAGFYDTRVSYWEAAKWTAKLRAMKTDNNILLLKTNMGAGHMGYSGRYDYLKDKAFDYAFILDIFGIND
ncbi:S9 family peptidase [candidate division WOR-3 bacterium]|nr:S9 family peptidase [candidate division WOR-3 bacterium]